MGWRRAGARRWQVDLRLGAGMPLTIFLGRNPQPTRPVPRTGHGRWKEASSCWLRRLFALFRSRSAPLSSSVTGASRRKASTPSTAGSSNGNPSPHGRGHGAGRTRTDPDRTRRSRQGANPPRRGATHRVNASCRSPRVRGVSLGGREIRIRPVHCLAGRGWGYLSNESHRDRGGSRRAQ